MLQSSLGQAQRFKKRERTQNWAYEEKHFLLELCRKDMHIIENKRLDSALTTLKNRAWKIIHQQFAIAFGTDRNCNRLKEQWRRMKACTRAEMLDYQQRVQRFGQEVADRKKPSQFTFEIWEFMQEAKKVCKNELMDDVDYSKMKLSLEENLPQGVSIKECSDENDDESSSMWDKTSQNICEVQIKEDSQDEMDDYDKGSAAKYPRLRGLSSTSTPFGTASAAAEAAHSRFNELLATSFANRLANEHHHHHHLGNSGSATGNHNNNNNNNNNTASAHKLLESLDAYNRAAAAGFGNDSTGLADLSHGASVSGSNFSAMDLNNTLEALNLLKTRFNRMGDLGHWKNAFQEAQNLSTVNHAPDSPTGHSNAQNTLQGLANGGTNEATGLMHDDAESALPRACTPVPGLVGSNGTSRTLSKLLETHHQAEHDLRMEILRTDLETAKINKETAELNRKLALQKLQQGEDSNNVSNGSSTDRREEVNEVVVEGDDSASDSAVPIPQSSRLTVRTSLGAEGPPPMALSVSS
ncbi:AGAP007656-PA-like protein [Anopheles sinensis]|uniref:Regulatory protein zeste n=1 Tax=Anopheles sinensis TaxID=74873 RepID=A0A084VF93_ANOSI|nr:AGAP007656-PA-like protein [Anopheles sinensis]